MEPRAQGRRSTPNSPFRANIPPQRTNPPTRKTVALLVLTMGEMGGGVRNLKIEGEGRNTFLPSPFPCPIFDIYIDPLKRISAPHLRATPYPSYF